MAIKLVLAGDHPVYLAGLKQILEVGKEFRVLRQCSSGEEALTAVRELRPDIVILCSQIGRAHSARLVREIKNHKLRTRVVVIADHVSAVDTVELTRGGVSGVAIDGMAVETLLRCLRKVAAGERWVEESAANRAPEMLIRRQDQVQELAKLLTPRQIEIARLAAAGLRNKEIGKKLFIDEGTVKSHLHKVFVSLGVKGRHALANVLRDKELVSILSLGELVFEILSCLG